MILSSFTINNRQLIFLFLILLWPLLGYSQDPGWSVNSSSFQFSMTVTATININGQISADGNDKVAAFVNGQVRGVASPSVFISSRNELQVNMIVYGNTQGEPILFQVYDASATSVIAAVNPVQNFVIDGALGQIDNPFEIRTNNDPTNLSLSANSMQENTAASTTIGTFTTTDADNGDTHTYTLVAGEGSTDNGSFTISGNALRNGSIFDFEAKSSYSIRVRTTDNKNGFFEKSFNISVTNQNESPTNILLSESQTAENRAVGSVVGNLSSSDPDANENHTYTFSTAGGNGADNGAFTIQGNQLRVAQVFDFEVKSSYQIQIQTQDAGGLTFTKQFTVSVLDVNDVPTALTLSVTSVAENQPIATVVGTLTTTDQDANETFTYSFFTPQNTNDNGKFSINGDKLQTFEVFNFEVKNQYIVYVQVTDSKGAIFQRSFQIGINDVNEAPSTLTISNSSVNENAVTNSLVGSFTAEDPDGNTSFTYQLVSGAGDVDNVSFNISGSSLQSTDIFDFETKKTYLIRVRVSDAGSLFLEKTFTISINDINDRPSNIELSSNTIGENRASGTLIGKLTAIDQDATDSHIYSLVAGTGSNDNASFRIIDNELQSNAVFDVDTKSSYSIRISTDDKRGGTFEKQFTVTIIDQNDLPTDISLSNSTIEENKPTGTLVGNLTTSDADAGDTHTYTIEQFADFGAFQISGNALNSRVSFNYEEKNSYTVRIRTTDQTGGFYIEDFSISVLDVNEAPTSLNISSLSIAENLPSSSLVGTFTATDPDGETSFTYRLIVGPGSVDNQAFRIQNDQLLTAQFLDFETKSTYKIRVDVSDGGGLRAEESFEITVTDANDAPTNIDLSSNTINENRPVGTVIGKLTGVDQDVTDTHIFTLVDGTGSNDNSAFRIIGDELQANAVFDFDIRKDYSVRIKVDDNRGGTFQKVFSIKITDQNDAPSQLTLSNNTIDENATIGTIIGTFNTEDNDSTNTHIYALEQFGDFSSFQIIGNTLQSRVVFNHETKSNFGIRVKSTDDEGAFIVNDFSIIILDVNESPSDILLSNNSVRENEPISTQVGAFTMVDQDENETATFRLVTGANSTDNALFSISQNILFTESILDFETKANYSIRVEVEDKGGLKFTRTFNISAVDVNDAPTDIALTLQKVPENRPIGTLVGIMTSTDQDKDEQFTYTLVAGNGDSNNESFRIVNSELQTNTTFNFEQKSTYSIRMRSRDRAGATFDKVFTITIEDANDQPTDIVFETGPEIVSSNPSGSLVGKLKTIDEDATDNYRYDLIGGADGADNSLFRINGNELVTNAVLKDQPEILKIAIRVTDKGNLQLVKSFSISVTPSNRKPEAEDQILTVKEDSDLGDVLGQLVATDPDDGQVLDFIIINEESLERTFPFGLESNGELVVEKPEFLDILLEDKWVFMVRVSDNGTPKLFTDFMVTVNLEHVPGKSLPFNNYLSPNGDTKNDLLVIEQIEKYPNNSIAIYDNTGQQLYFQTNYQNNWDGTFRGNRLPKGSYTVVFKNETTGKVLRSSFAILY